MEGFVGTKINDLTHHTIIVLNKNSDATFQRFDDFIVEESRRHALSYMLVLNLADKLKYQLIMNKKLMSQPPAFFRSFFPSFFIQFIPSISLPLDKSLP